ncbi:hypothetical protein KY345_05900 [Candidatus Woesearchaeota archaeon]|nr:hypothetical protein [Candidatus Woesearchaeota archaeon]
METPNYSTKPNITRVLVPRIIILLVLSALLYVGIRINFAVFNMEFPGMINILVIIFIIILAAADIFLTNMKNKENKIYFFNDRIEIKGKEDITVALGPITDAEVKKDFFDKILKTGSIVLSNGQIIKNLNYPDRIREYIMQLLRRAPALKK